MASLKTKTLVNGDNKKRKRDVEDAEIIHIPPTSLEIDSDGEDSASSDDGEAEPFPELDSGSSDTSSDEREEEEEEGNEHDTDDTEVDEEDGVDGTPPLDGKTVISSITGRPKRVYPEIDPEYDSDSSTEEVRRPCLVNLPLMPCSRTPIE
jgi:ribosome biogenesis protein ERB1